SLGIGPLSLSFQTRQEDNDAQCDQGSGHSRKKRQCEQRRLSSVIAANPLSSMSQRLDLDIKWLRNARPRASSGNAKGRLIFGVFASKRSFLCRSLIEVPGGRCRFLKNACTV